LTIYYLCPVNTQQPSGGVRRLYQHVDILNEAGIDAAVVHGERDFHCTWFDNRTRIASPDLRVTDTDVLAFPEVYGDALRDLAPGIPRVSINQNAYNTFWRVSDISRHPYGTTPELLGVMCVSEDNAAYLRYGFSQIPVVRIRNGIDPSIFFDSGEDERGRTLAFMPRKRARESAQVLGLLQSRGITADWRVVEVDGMTEREVATVLRSTAIFLSFSDHEGCPLPPAEAMACGAYVVGYTGFGAREYMRSEFASPVEDGDVVAFARATEDAIRDFETASDQLRERTQAAARHVASVYSLEHQRQDVLEFYADVLRRAPAPNGVAVTISRADLGLKGRWHIRAWAAKQTLLGRR
jgi:glycosyltransferase involved in cell wall biosynthesis